MIYFIGAGPGAADLITVRGRELLKKADIVIYAGSLVNPELLDNVKKGCRIYDSACMTLEEVTAVMCANTESDIVRLHTGDPCIYGAIREQMDILDSKGIEYQSVPGVSSFIGAASALNAEFTLPGVSQTVILTRMGMYDGVGFNDDSCSANHISRITGTPEILVVNAKGKGISLAAEISGYLGFAENRIKGIILDGCSENMYSIYAGMLENRLHVEDF